MKEATSRFWLNLRIKENMPIQKSRLVWLNDGDTNSGFFHKDFIRFFNDFHSSGVISETVIASFLILIPKSPNALGLKDYRPICLTGCLYKAISKLLEGRLKCVLDSIISPNQSEFILGRKLLDGVMVANKVVDFAQKEGRSCFLFKVDFEKAYHKVN
ncbi:uncharacterized protein LOC131637932 [Vicia villosa]|uniref:uncharacterized protein LOC131637932 n=1 Tax=Vicia villosa TaxID=3911 RepID=UPI00273CCAEE|nr:uncharacterized protein LOC131637932 [Vicia villosa]